MSADADRKAILARRKLLLASALAGLSTTQCDNPFKPCLEIAPVNTTAPAVCLSPVVVEAGVAPSAVPDAAGDATTPATRLPAGEAGVAVAPGVSATATTQRGIREPPPRPCLKPLPRDEGEPGW